jgi:signal transduction histidine kinase
MKLDIEHLYRIEKFMESITDFDRLLEAIIRESANALAAESASLALYDEDTDELYFYVVRGKPSERDFELQLKSVRIKKGEGVAGRCAAMQMPVIIQDAYNDPRFDPSADRKTGFKTRNLIAVPMIYRGKLVGVVEAVNKTGADGFDRLDEKVLSVLASQAALVIENARLVQENLRQARAAAMGEGIAGAAHCIKNILAGVGSGEYVMQTGLKKGDLSKVEKGWEVLKRNTDLMRDLVLDMLNVAKPREPETEPTDVNSVCSAVADLMGPRATERGVAIELALAEEIGERTLDPKGIYRCVLNLVGNAVDACSEPNGRVKISTADDRQGLAVSVSDNGCGISPENQEKLFEAFFSTKGSKGTGLGLAVTHKIIEEHGGTIAVQSEEGKGTTFTMRFP